VRTEYSGDEDEVQHLPPISALSIENNAFRVIVSSPRTPGQPLNVQTYPRSSGFEIINTGVSVAPRAPSRKSRGSRKKRRSEIIQYDSRSLASQDALDALLDDDSIERAGDEPLLAYNTRSTPKKKSAAKSKATSKQKAPAKKQTATKRKGVTAKTTAASKKKSTRAVAAKKSSTTRVREKANEPDVASTASVGGLRVSVTGDRGEKQTIRVSGGLTANRTSSYRYEMKNPPLVVAGMVYDRLRAHGIRISGQPVTGSSPRQVKVIGEVRRPLLEILESVMKNSNNYLAEYVFKMIGAAHGGQKSTAERSGEVIDQRMTRAHVPFGKCVINDGSGLSRANCLSASALAAMLTAAHRDAKVFPALYSTMAIAGVDGTLRRRMKGTYAEGNVRGKTGTLRNVSALAGYVTSRDGEMFVFAMLMNGGRHGAYKGVQDRVAQRLAAFSYGESATVRK
jgi:PBP4 family serine-type D-alanyl-D-alanine carboxypeptidase